MQSRILLALIPTLFAFAFSAQEFPVPPAPLDHGWCGTTESRLDDLERRFEWTRERSRLSKAVEAHAPARSRVDGQIILQESTPDSMPFDHPFDLEGKSLSFTPDKDGFLVETRALDYDDDIGDFVLSFRDNGTPDWYRATVFLPQFEFPFGDASFDRLHVTAFNAIHTESPDLVTTTQLNEIEALSLEGGIISPLMLTRHTKYQFDFPDLYVNHRSDSITITWRVAPTRFFEYDIQARLESNGNIKFSYRTVRNIFWGSVLVTTGDEPLRTDRTNLYSEGTPSNAGPQGSIDQMLDLRSVSIDRLADSKLLEITLTTAVAPNRGRLDDGEFLGYLVEFGNLENTGVAWVYLYLENDDWYYYTPAWGWKEQSPAATMRGSEITLRVSEDDIDNFFGTNSFSVRTYHPGTQGAVDTLGGPFSLGPDSDEPLALDISQFSEPIPQNGPILEAFTLPDFVPGAAWSDLKRTHGFRDDDVDAVAFFQDFHSDLMLYASAYSTVGNPAADGVSKAGDYGTSLARRPALLHMNKADFGLNVDLPEAVHVLGHELGHRWLYFIDIDTGSGPTNVLRPGGGHPAQYVHTPAAYRVFTDVDSSTMGGATFTDHGNGTFTAPDPVGFYGYSWHELYLMGLARPDEVEHWWYIENSNPPLGPAYYPPAGITVSGTRRNVGIDDIVRAMGPRNPTMDTSQKRFRVLFVLMSRPGNEPSQAMLDLVEERRREFDRVFFIATGGRGSIDSRMVAVPKRRGVRR